MNFVSKSNKQKGGTSWYDLVSGVDTKTLNTKSTIKTEHIVSDSLNQELEKNKKVQSKETFDEMIEKPIQEFTGSISNKQQNANLVLQNTLNTAVLEKDEDVVEDFNDTTYDSEMLTKEFWQTNKGAFDFSEVSPESDIKEVILANILNVNPAIPFYVRTMLIHEYLKIDKSYSSYSNILTRDHIAIKHCIKQEKENRKYVYLGNYVLQLIRELNIPKYLEIYTAKMIILSVDLFKLDENLEHCDILQYYLDYAKLLVTMYSETKSSTQDLKQVKQWERILSNSVLRYERVEYEDIKGLTETELKKYDNLEVKSTLKRLDILALYAAVYATLEGLYYRDNNAKFLTVNQLISLPHIYDHKQMVTLNKKPNLDTANLD